MHSLQGPHRAIPRPRDRVQRPPSIPPSPVRLENTRRRRSRWPAPHSLSEYVCASRVESHPPEWRLGDSVRRWILCLRSLLREGLRISRGGNCIEVPSTSIPAVRLSLPARIEWRAQIRSPFESAHVEVCLQREDSSLRHFSRIRRAALRFPQRRTCARFPYKLAQPFRVRALFA